MEPVDARLSGVAMPPPVSGRDASGVASASPGWPHATTTPVPPAAARVTPPTSLLGLARWRVLGALALTGAFGLIGWQVQRRIVDRPWSDGIMWMAVAAALVAATCVLVWTWTAAENGRRLVGPATGRDLPDPRAVVATWLVPFGFIALAVGVVAYLGGQVGTGADQTVAAIPLAVAVIAVLLAIPLTYRPLNSLAVVVRQIGGYSVKVAQWMWVPLVLALVGVGSIVALRLGIDDEPSSATDASGWAPLWVVAIVAIAPCLIVVLLAWRAARSVEDAIAHAASQRRPGWTSTAAAPRSLRQRTSRRRGSMSPSNDTNRRVRQLPGADILRLGVVTLLAGLALLGVVGAAVMVMAWSEADGDQLLPADRRRAWDMIDLLRDMSRTISLVLLVVVAVWTFVAVTNVRLASGRRVNPVIAAAAWPIAALGIWAIADRLVDESIGRVVLGFAAQAVVLAVPFLVLEHAADAIGARRTPIRMSYAFGVVLLVHLQGLGGSSTIQETSDPTDLARTAGYFAIGALVQLTSTMAVTEACRSMTRAALHEAEHHNLLVDQRAGVSRTPTPAPTPSR